jgi:glycosyltransferase involved in cell wall biosynthesis
MKLVSVIIPCYNREQWLEKCIHSVLNQTYYNLEIIIIDDGSSDRTFQIVKSFNDKRIKYFYKENGGHASARNFGINQSIGEWIAFLDSDDYWDKHKIKTQLSYGDFDAIYCNANIIDEKGSIIKNNKSINFEKLHSDIKNNILLANIITGSSSSIILKTSIIKRVGYFRNDLKIGEDWEYWARAIWLNIKIKYVTEKLTFIRTHLNSTQSNAKQTDFSNSKTKILKSFLNYKGISSFNKSMIYKKLFEISYSKYNAKKFLNFYIQSVSHNFFLVVNLGMLYLIIKYFFRYLFTKYFYS